MNRSPWPVRALWMLTGALTLPAALTGLLFPEIYRGVVAADLLPFITAAWRDVVP